MMPSPRGYGKGSQHQTRRSDLPTLHPYQMLVVALDLSVAAEVWRCRGPRRVSVCLKRYCVAVDDLGDVLGQMVPSMEPL